MQISIQSLRHLLSLTAFGIVIAVLPQNAGAQAVTVSTLANFDGTNGDTPDAALTLGRDGNFYGTTNALSADRTTKGTIFKLTPAGALSTQFAFAYQNNANPVGSGPNGLVQGSDGVIYGTNSEGGTNGVGTVFGLAPGGALGVIHTFEGGYGKGTVPKAGLIQGRDGNLYGTTSEGFDNYGSVFAASPSGGFTQLAVFYGNAANDGTGLYGRNPAAALLQGSDGNFYGTTPTGGPGGRGTVFKYTPGSGLSVLVSFSGPNGADPLSELIQGPDGNFYGTTSNGGSRPNPNYAGTVFRITPAGQLTTLVNFDGTNGSGPKAALVLGHDGNFYGTTYSGGSGFIGTIFKMTPAGVLTTIYNFPNDGMKGGYPTAALIQGSNGDFYGTTILGGSGGRGTVFRMNISPNSVQEKTLGNIATRLQVGTGDNALIGGFIVTGVKSKKVIVRGIGPSLTGFGVQGAMANPTLELRDASGQLLASNDDWKDAQQTAIEATGIAPTNNLESAIVADLPSANARYTATLRGKNNTTGIGVVEVYDLDQTVDSRLGNISTRGFVNTGDNVMVGGFIVGPSTKVGVRGIGPSLSQFGIANPLQNPSIDLRDANGAPVAFNDNWTDSQQAEIQAAGLAPTDSRESALIQTLAAGNYTVTLRGVDNTTGIGVIEAYNLP